MKVRANPSAVAAIVGGIVAVAVIRYLETHEPDWILKRAPFWLRFAPSNARAYYVTRRARERVSRAAAN